MIDEAREKAEAALASEGVLFVDRTLDTLRVTGPDRQSWLNGLVTQNLVPRKAGEAALAIAVTKAGKIETEVAILFGEDDLLLGVREGRALAEKLDRHLIMEDAAIELAEEATVWTFAFGARAEEAVREARAVGGRGGVTTRAGAPVALLATSDRSFVDAATRAITPSAHATSDEWERARVRLGIAEAGVDYGVESYPQEAALERDEVSFETGCYLGQEAVFMLEKRGHVQKRLVQIASKDKLEKGAAITDADGKPIGEVTTAVELPSGSLALGVVKYKHARAGREIRVGGSTAVVTALLALAD